MLYEVITDLSAGDQDGHHGGDDKGRGTQNGADIEKVDGGFHRIERHDFDQPANGNGSYNFV